MPFGQSPGQGFSNPGVVIAELLEIIGAKGRILVYSPTEALNNLVLAISGVNGVDPSGNDYLAGLTVGNVNSGNYTWIDLTGQIFLFNNNVATIELDPIAQTLTIQDPAKIIFPSGDSMEGVAANIAAEVVGTGVTRFLQTLLSGPKGNPAGANDWVQLQENSANDGATTSASMFFVYIDISGVTHSYAFMDQTGFNIEAGTILARDPSTTPGVSETWKTLTLLNSYTSGANPGGFVDVPQIRMDADNKMLHLKGTLVTPNPVTSPIIAAVPSNYPNANLGGNYGMGTIIGNHTMGQFNQLRVQNNGNISFQVTPGTGITFDITCQILTQ